MRVSVFGKLNTLLLGQLSVLDNYRPISILAAGVENVSDHGTIGPRKFWGSQKIFQVHIYKIF